MTVPDRIQVPIKGMTCAACVARVEKVLNRLPGVDARVNLATELAHVTLADPRTTIETVRSAIEAAGYAVGALHQDPMVDERRESRIFWLSAALSVPFLLQMVAMVGGSTHGLLPGWLQWILATPVQFWIGWRFYRGAWFALRGGTANMDVLIALGTTAAYLYSAAVVTGGLPGHHVYFEASVFIITLVLLGKILEYRARRHTNDALKDLARMLPRTAHVLREGVMMEVEAQAVGTDELVIIRPDERAPVDGLVVEGQSDMDESLITGEAQLTAKGPGAKVFAGARNAQGQLLCRATRTGARTHLAEVAALVEEAQSSKAPVQQWADRVSAVFVPAILVLGAGTWIGWWIQGSGIETAMLNAIAVLVIACPCALGLATPTAVVAAMGRGAQFAILMRHASVLEAAARIQHLVVDKTGTLTQGMPRVVALHAAHGLSDSELLRITASIEQTSVHPVAHAIGVEAQSRNLSLSVPTEVFSEAGRGIRATIDGRVYRLGSPAFLAEQGFRIDQSLLQQDGMATCTVVALADTQNVLGYIGLSDPVRPTTPRAVARLRDKGIEVTMLTGDRQGVAKEIAEAVGISSYRAQMLPGDKALEVKRLQANGSIVVGMAGDGVNDAPALATADVGFAMGGGADLAVQTADITLMRNDLTGIVNAIELARASVRVIRQNLFFALIYNVVCIPLAAAGMLNPIIAGAAMAMSSVTVVTNSLRLRQWSPS